MTVQEALEETKYQYIYEIANVDGKAVKLYKLTQWSKNRLDNAVQKSDFDWFTKNDFSSLRERVAFLEEACRQLARDYIKSRIELTFSSGKRYRLSDIVRKVSVPRHLFNISEFIDDLIKERKLKAIEKGRYVKS